MSDALVADVLDGLAAGDLDGIRLLLHPYLHWTFADGTTVRGRTRVLARLGDEAIVAPPASVELRDGQLYRWAS